MIKYLNSPSEVRGRKVYNNAIEALMHLKNGEEVARFEYGNSMSPILKSGEYCVLLPINNINDVEVGDAVFCRVNGHLMTHMVFLKSNSSYGGPMFLITDTNFHVYGWTNEIFAIAKGINEFEKPQYSEFKSQLCKLSFIDYESGSLLNVIHYIANHFGTTIKQAKNIVKHETSPILGYFPLDECERYKKELEKIGGHADYDETENEETYDYNADDTPSVE